MPEGKIHSLVKERVYEHDQRYLGRVGLDPRKLGPQIGMGYEYRTLKYGPDLMVKIPHPTTGFRPASPEKSLWALREYNPSFSSECEVVRKGRDFVLLQEPLEPCSFSVNSPQFFNIVFELAEGNRAMFHEQGMSVDLISNALKLEGLKRDKSVTNIMMSERGPVMSDITLFSVIPRATNNLIFLGAALADQLYIQYQAGGIRRQLGVDII